MTRIPRFGGQATVLAACVTVAVVLAQHTAGAAFTATTGNATDQVSSAASFCTSPTTRTVNPTADTSVYQAQPTTYYGTNVQVGTVSASGGVSRALLTFPLTSPGAFCTITAATLKLYVTTTTLNHEVDVYRVDPATAWTEAGTNWNNRPNSIDTPAHVPGYAPAVGTTQTWNVTALVQAMSTGTNNGLQIQDVTEGVGSATVYWGSKESANVPQLVLTWG